MKMNLIRSKLKKAWEAVKIFGPAILFAACAFAALIYSENRA